MAPARMEKLEIAIRLVLDFNTAINNHNLSRVSELISDDCVFEAAFPSPDGFRYSGKNGITQYLQDTYDTYPDAHIEIEEIFSLSFRCVMRWRFEWLNESGERSHSRGVDIYQVKDGLINQRLSYTKGSP